MSNWKGFIVAEIDETKVEADVKQICGMEIHFIVSCDPKNAIMMGPLKFEESDMFWKLQYETTKHLLSDDYKDCLEMMLSGDSGMIAYMEIEKLKNIRQMKKEDAEEYNNSLEMLIDKYKLNRFVVTDTAPKVFKMNDYEWWCTHMELDEFYKWYLKEHGLDEDDNPLEDIVEYNIDKSGLWCPYDDEYNVERIIKKLDGNDEVITPNKLGSVKVKDGEYQEFISFRNAIEEGGYYEGPYCIASCD